MWEFLGAHPVAAFFLILATGWALHATFLGIRGVRDDCCDDCCKKNHKKDEQ